MLYGFKKYLQANRIPVPHDKGLAELSRLEKGHYLIAMPVEHEIAWNFLSGKEGLRHVSPEMIVNAYRIENMAKTVKDALLIMPIPKRWFSRSQLETKGLTGAIGEFLPLGDEWKLPANYVWGYFSKWDENKEAIEDIGQFYRNQNYHGHDGLYEKWKKTYGEPRKPIVLAPKAPTPHNPHGYRTYHGYSEVEFE